MAEPTSTPELTTNVALALSNLLAKLQFSSLGVLTDTNTKEHCYPLIEEILPGHSTLVIQPGEIHKNIDTCGQIWEYMTAHKMDRHALLINLGGGVIGDMGGFCAATYKRGIRFINLPTTLLAQVDASIGGKLGVDFQGYKNHIGLFQDPCQVIISAEFLKTLPLKELRSGFAEVLKHALIADGDYWSEINTNSWEDQLWQLHIDHSVKVKQKVVNEDPQEKGSRKILNFGHTVGHAVERYYLSQPNPLLHGEAIAVGMICEAFLSSKKVELSSQQLNEISTHLLKWFGKIPLETTDMEKLVQNALQDKKNVDGKIKCSLLQKIGTAVYDVDVTTDELVESLVYYRQLKASC